MGYFSNGTEGMGYQEAYCLHCRNWRDLHDGRGEGCAVWDAHLAYNSEKDKEPVLNALIPRCVDGSNAQCLMFLPEPKAVRRKSAKETP
jgi:hypothetical protein